MANVIVPPWKCCGNCGLWGGPRIINGPLQRAEVPDMYAKGPCIDKNGAWTPTYLQSACDKFVPQPGVKLS